MSWPNKLKTPVATLAPVLHPEIEDLQRRLLSLYEEQRAALDHKPTAELEELLQRCLEERQARKFTVRVAAEINAVACEMILQARRNQP